LSRPAGSVGSHCNRPGLQPSARLTAAQTACLNHSDAQSAGSVGFTRHPLTLAIRCTRHDSPDCPGPVPPLPPPFRPGHFPGRPRRLAPCGDPRWTVDKALSRKWLDPPSTHALGDLLASSAPSAPRGRFCSAPRGHWTLNLRRPFPPHLVGAPVVSLEPPRCPMADGQSLVAVPPLVRLAPGVTDGGLNVLSASRSRCLRTCRGRPNIMPC
jgi:hypothetical protein